MRGQKNDKMIDACRYIWKKLIAVWIERAR